MPRVSFIVSLALFFFLIWPAPACSERSTHVKPRQRPVSSVETSTAEGVLLIRTLSLIVFLDGYTTEEVLRELRKVENGLLRQVSIRLQVTHFYAHDFKEKSTRFVMTDMFRRLYFMDSEFDIAMAFVKRGLAHRLGLELIALTGIPFPLKQGEIDRKYCRYIVIRELEASTILHELTHAISFQGEPGGEKAVSLVSLKLLPFLPPFGGGSVKLSGKEKKLVLNGKWRRFQR
jgi:hypothetical protein